MTEFLKKIKETYSTDNPNLLNLLKYNDFLELGYSEKILKKFDNIIEYAFPVVYPFDDNVIFKEKIVLDLGCGAGLDSIVALSLGAKEVYSIDISLSFLNLNKLKNIHKINADIANIPIKFNKIDIVIMNGSLNLIFDKTTLLKNLNGIIKKEGILIIGDLFWNDVSSRHIYAEDPDAWSWCVGGGLTEEELFNMANMFNFQLLKKDFLESIENLERVRYIFKNG